METVPGVPSFCAVAARLNLPLAEWDEPFHVAPALHETGGLIDQPGACILMKPASRMADVKEQLRRSGRQIFAVEDCGMEAEKVYRCIEEIPDDAGYLSLIIAKERQDRG